MFDKHKTTEMRTDEPRVRTKQWYAIPDHAGVPAFSCEAESMEDAKAQYETFKKSLIK